MFRVTVNVWNAFLNLFKIKNKDSGTMPTDVVLASLQKTPS